MEFLKRYQDPIYALTRIVVGFLFLCHGVQKFGAILSGESQMPTAVLWAAAIIETLGGALIALGLFATWAAFVCSGQMAVAYFMAHQPQALLPLQNRGELAVLYSWIFLMIAAKGAGIWSVDAARARAPAGGA